MPDLQKPIKLVNTLIAELEKDEDIPVSFSDLRYLKDMSRRFTNKVNGAAKKQALKEVKRDAR